MKIALLSPTPVPPTFGGMNRLLDGLADALRRRHPTDLVTIPFDERTRDGVLRGYYDFYQLDLSRYDRVISYKAPGYMTRHPNHVVYLSHRLRVFYDLFEPAGEEHEKMRELTHWMDGWALDKKRIPHLFTVGETVSRRLCKYGNIDSTPIHHPTTFQAVEPKKGEYFLSVGRLHPWKRVDLIVKAFRKSRADCPLKIVGEGPQEEELRELAEGDPRIEFVGKVDDAQLAESYSSALTTIFPPINEDMGLITFESFLAGKPILTTTDSGEPALIVEEGKTGFIASPTAESLAERMDWIWDNRSKLEGMTESCRTRGKEVTWDRLVDSLLGAGDRIEGRKRESEHEQEKEQANGTRMGFSRPPERSAIRLLVTDNQIIDPPVGGGRVRIFELYRHMPEDFTTTYVGAFDYPGPGPRDQNLAPNFREILTPLTARHFKMHGVFSRLTRGDATIDVTMPVLGKLTPRYRRLIEKHLPDADFLICAHPWMFPFLPPNDLPLIYDSQNCEAVVKGQLLNGWLMGRYLKSKVRETERKVVEQSRLVLACSEEDAKSFCEIYGTDPEIILEIPNGVDCKAIQPADDAARRREKSRLGLVDAADGVDKVDRKFAIFTGSNYVPNLQGAEFIAFEMAPAFPEIQFGIVGGVGPLLKERHPDRELPKNVLIFGFVEREKLLSLYRAADFALNPMSQGSGTNLKMLDYMAAGLTILTTPVGARGIKGKTGEHWIESPKAEFIAEFRKMISAPECVKELGKAGRVLAEARYDWKLIAERLAGRLREEVAPASRP